MNLIFALCCLWAVERVIKYGMKLKAESYKAEQFKALSQLDSAAQIRLIETMPDWLDKDSHEDVEAWKEARAETLQLTGK
jgi:hypothetical protein